MKTKYLMDDALDWAVAMCEGLTLEPSYHAWVRRTFSHAGWSEGRIEQHLAQIGEDHPVMRDSAGNAVPIPTFSRDWSMAGPIIERETIDIQCLNSPKECGVGLWLAEITGTRHKAKGRTPIIAALRCYVASRLGEEVDLPAGLAAA